MRYLHADSMDMVDPAFDFLRDRHSMAEVRPHTRDAYPHEILGRAPYGGMLLSMATVRGGVYTMSQDMRLSREGARAFLRLDDPRHADVWIMGDCGAFSYRNETHPTWSPTQVSQFYADGGFTHGCSPDHLIFDHGPDDAPPTDEARRRYDLTIENARLFLNEAVSTKARFEPVGVVQGWSAGSMAAAARDMRAMGYRYLALGGMVPLKTPEILSVLGAVRDAVPHDVGVHLLGYGKADGLRHLAALNLTSFDTTSPMTRAFKDAKANYHLPSADGLGVDHWTAIRIPQALENDRMTQAAKRGLFVQEHAVRDEREALDALRGYDAGRVDADAALGAVMRYSRTFLGAEASEAQLKALDKAYRRTLHDTPWRRCGCAVCQDIGVEVIVYRGSNRNKRRGMHNVVTLSQVLSRSLTPVPSAELEGHVRKFGGDPAGPDLAPCDLVPARPARYPS